MIFPQTSLVFGYAEPEARLLYIVAMYSRILTARQFLTLVNSKRVLSGSFTGAEADHPGPRHNANEREKMFATQTLNECLAISYK